MGIGYWFFSFSIKAFYIVTLAWFLWRLGVFPLLAFFSCILVSFVFLDNMLRQQVAFGFILVSVACVRDRKILAFVCLCLASSFHFSAVFFIPFYFLYISFSFRNLFAFVAVLSFFIGLSGNSIVDYLVNFLAGADGGYLGRALAYLEFDGYPVTLGHYFRFLILLMFVFLDLVIRGRQLSEQDSRIWRLISSGVILMLFYEMVFYEFSVFWMRIREYFLVFFMVSPLFLFRVFFWREARIFSALYVVYPLAVFWGVITGLPVYDDLYRDYRNYIVYLAVGDDGFDSIRDLAAQDYWDRWRRGELR
ncbi:EpsG family protein [Pseudomonas aeruginosa]|nr:EpsG family protein [Pseudomonas aeruginosa]